jgi:hypothetical protein
MNLGWSVGFALFAARPTFRM